MRWLLLDGIEELVEGESAVGFRRFAPEEPFFEDHFPGFPVVPGVLLLEALAQLSGKLIGYTVRRQRGDWPFPILSMADRVKFRRFVRPGQQVRLETQLTELREEAAMVRVRARVDGTLCTQAEQVFVFNAVPLDDEAERVRVEAIERAHLAALWPGYVSANDEEKS
ncbi:MAG: 3-hydroxyacyl-ACP dehydratase FabZ family protein [Myxococcota bacterium]|nr:3-hydroxyacyl-ACP dehydratase FabZ family protein [Myxococcota bacterium]